MARPAQYQKLSLQLDAENQKLKQKLKDMRRQMGGVSKVTRELGSVIAGAFTVREITRFGVQASKLAGEAEGVREAFTRIGGDKVMESLKNATKNTVSELDLMKRAVQARNFDIPLKDLSSLFQFATKRAQQTGESVDYLVNSIVLGIGRKSPLILDNLGISAIRLRKELKGAGVEANTVADVAAAVGRIAQVEMARAGDIIETTSIKTAQWSASWDNLTVSVGTFINKGLNKIAPAVDKIIPVVNRLAESLFGGKSGRLERDIAGHLQGLNDMTAPEKEAQLKKWNNRISELNDLISDTESIVEEGKDLPWWANNQHITKAKNEIKKYTNELALLTGIVNELDKPQTVATPSSEPAAIVKKEDKKAMQDIAVWSDEVISNWDRLGSLSEVFAPEVPEWLQDPAGVDAIVSGWEIAGEKADEYNNKVREIKDQQTEAFVSLAGIIQSMATGISVAKDNWAAMGATVLSGIAQAIPAVQQVIQLTKSLFAAKQAEAVASGIASSQTVPFPGNLIAMATTVGAILSTIAPFVGSFAKGTDFVPQTGLAMIHKGERIIPAAQNRGGGHVTFEIRGDRLFGVLDEFNRRRSASF